MTTKENPVISDPLYPGNHGYAFKGYSFDQTGNPTFRYLCHQVTIADQSEVRDGEILARKFVFDSAEKGVIYFRALAGKITKESEGVFAVPGLKIKASEKNTILRPSAREGERELLVRIALAKGKTNYSIDYEMVR